MKKLALGLALALIFSSLATARLIETFSYEELYEKSDLVVIVELVTVSESKEILSGWGEPDRYEGKVSQFSVGKVLKGNADILTISLLHFAYSAKVLLIANGANFVDFSNAEKYHYLMFLNEGDEGVFSPVTGHYDAAASVMKIVREQSSPILNEK